MAKKKNKPAPPAGGKQRSGGGLRGDDQTVLWYTLPPLGAVVAWLVMSAALATGSWAAGGEPWSWPGVRVLWQVAWLMVSEGLRLDAAWLLVSGSSSVAPAVWLWLLAAGYTALLAVCAIAAREWWENREDSSGAVLDWLWFGGGKKKGKKKQPVKHFRRPKWPIPGPYSPVVPGPGVLLGRDRRRHIVAADGLPVLVAGPTGSGKTRHVIGPNVGHWPGPVVATSVKTDLAEMTLTHRREHGRCWGFDPTGRLWGWMREMGITPVVWDPVRLLQQNRTRELGTLYAQFLASQSSSKDAGAQGIWATLAQQFLTEVLLLAAEMNASLQQALTWLMGIKDFVGDRSLQEQFTALSTEGRRSLDQLKSLAAKDDRFQGSVEITIKEVAESLEHTAANADMELIPMDLTTGGGSDTLYLIADHMSQTTHKPLFAAVVRHLFHVTETAMFDPDRRPPRPLFGLDELANLAKLPDLPEVLSTIRSRAQVICGIQERAQLSAGWGNDSAVTLIGNHPTKVQLPGSSDASALQDWATLSADTNRDDDDRDTAAAWRTIPKGHARILAGNHDAFEVEMADPDRWLADPPEPTEEPAAAAEAESGPFTPPDDPPDDPLPDPEEAAPEAEAPAAPFPADLIEPIECDFSGRSETEPNLPAAAAEGLTPARLRPDQPAGPMRVDRFVSDGYDRSAGNGHHPPVEPAARPPDPEPMKIDGAYLLNPQPPSAGPAPPQRRDSFGWPGRSEPAAVARPAPVTDGREHQDWDTLADILAGVSDELDGLEVKVDAAGNRTVQHPAGFIVGLDDAEAAAAAEREG